MKTMYTILDRNINVIVIKVNKEYIYYIVFGNKL
jgi:hypothetical protein